MTSIEDLEAKVAAMQLWVAEHDGRIEAWWEAQREWNAKMETQVIGLTQRLTAVEKRMMWWAGAAAGAGGWIGSYFG